MGFFARLTGWERLYPYFEGKWVDDRVSGRRGLVIKDHGGHYPHCQVIWEKTTNEILEYKSKLKISDNQEDCVFDPNNPATKPTSPPPPAPHPTEYQVRLNQPKSTAEILAGARAAAQSKAANKREPL